MKCWHWLVSALRANGMSDFADNIREGNRRAIAKAITLMESSRDDHQR